MASLDSITRKSNFVTIPIWISFVQTKMTQRQPGRATTFNLFTGLDLEQARNSPLFLDDITAMARRNLFDLHRGDIVHLGEQPDDRNRNKFIFNGERLEELATDLDDYGSVPLSYLVPSEFPPRYWGPTPDNEDNIIDHNRYIGIANQGLERLTESDIYVSNGYLILPVQARNQVYTECHCTLRPHSYGVYYFITDYVGNPDEEHNGQGQVQPLQEEIDLFLERLHRPDAHGMWSEGRVIARLPWLDPELVIEIHDPQYDGDTFGEP